MRERAPIPNSDARRGLGLRHGALCFLASEVRSGKRTDDVVLRSDSECPSDVAKNAVDLLISAESIEVQDRAAWRLGQQFFVCHEFPRVGFVPHGEQSTAVVPTQSDSTRGSLIRHNTSPCGGIASVPPAIVHAERQNG